jgi:uncharacterized protein (DUF433 family)
MTSNVPGGRRNSGMAVQGTGRTNRATPIKAPADVQSWRSIGRLARGVYRRAPDRADVRAPLAYLGPPRGADSARLAHRAPVRPGAIRAPANVQSSRSIGRRTRGVYARAPNRATARTGLAFPRPAGREVCTKPRPAGHSGRSTTHMRSRLRLGRTMERWPTTDSTSSFATGGAHGQPHSRGTRIPVTAVLDCLASGMSEEEIHSRYPTLRSGSIRAPVEAEAEREPAGLRRDSRVRGVVVWVVRVRKRRFSRGQGASAARARTGAGRRLAATLDTGGRVWHRAGAARFAVASPGDGRQLPRLGSTR